MKPSSKHRIACAIMNMLQVDLYQQINGSMSGGRANHAFFDKANVPCVQLKRRGKFNYAFELGQMVLYEEPFEEHLHEEERERIRNVHSGVLKHSIYKPVLVFVILLIPSCPELLLI